jgi:hypothetical protein
MHLLLLFNVRPANQPTITGVAFAIKRLDAHDLKPQLA